MPGISHGQDGEARYRLTSGECGAILTAALTPIDRPAKCRRPSHRGLTAAPLKQAPERNTCNAAMDLTARYREQGLGGLIRPFLKVGLDASETSEGACLHRKTG